MDATHGNTIAMSYGFGNGYHPLFSQNVETENRNLMAILSDVENHSFMRISIHSDANAYYKLFLF